MSIFHSKFVRIDFLDSFEAESLKAIMRFPSLKILGISFLLTIHCININPRSGFLQYKMKDNDAYAIITIGFEKTWSELILRKNIIAQMRF